MVKVKRERRNSTRRSIPEVLDIRDEYAEERPVVREPRRIPREIYQEEPSKGSRKPLWVVAIVAVLFFLFALSFVFTSATVTVTPRMKSVKLNENIAAVKELVEDTDLPFDLVVISGQVEKKLPSGELKDVSTSAKGVVVLYNKFSTASQRLDINTRLEGSNGKIYKTEKAITVPGMKGTTPGSVEVSVYGAEDGASYNSEPLDFNILGFKGGPKYTKFYGRSKGPLAGGFVGQSPTISDKDKEALHNSLKLDLQDSLTKKATSQIPEGFVLFNDAVSVNIDSEYFSDPSSDGMVTASMKGTLHGVLFNEERLTGKIAQTKIENYDGSNVYIPNMKNLTFLLTSPSDLNTSSSIESVEFNLSGDASIVYKVDEHKLTEDLLGKSKKNLNQVLAQYKNIETVQTALSPFWKTTFPEQLSKIKIIVNYPK